MEFYKPYTYRKRGRIWFTTIWEILFEGLPIQLKSRIWTGTLEETKTVVAFMNGAYNLGYQARSLEVMLDK